MADTATRYSGSTKIEIRYHDAPRFGPNGGYTVTIRRAGGATHKTSVRPPAHITRAVDGAEAFDDAAKAALSFAESDGFETGAEMNASGSGWAISRRKPSDKVPRAPRKMRRA